MLPLTAQILRLKLMGICLMVWNLTHKVQRMVQGFLSDGVMYVFNPEHDLCLANGDPNFVPPESALTFGKDCAGVAKLMSLSSCGCLCDIAQEDPESISPWGWNPMFSRALSRAGVRRSLLPPDGFIDSVKNLSHRRMALKAMNSVYECMCKEPGLCRLLVPPSSIELSDLRQIEDFVKCCGDAVAKAPWSGSGHGLRWLRAGAVSGHDEGWCRNVISRQGSVILERRQQVVQDFAMLFHIGPVESLLRPEDSDAVSFDGYSLFFCENGSYSGNLLASDRHILNVLSQYVPEKLLTGVKAAVEMFLKDNFAGRYRGSIGVDMFICRNVEPGPEYLVNACTEINVRMTMGLVARRLYDLHMNDLSWRCPSGGCMDGKYVMKVLYNNDCQALQSILQHASALPFPVPSSSHYALAVFPANYERNW